MTHLDAAFTLTRRGIVFLERAASRWLWVRLSVHRVMLSLWRLVDCFIFFYASDGLVLTRRRRTSARQVDARRPRLFRRRISTVLNFSWSLARRLPYREFRSVWFRYVALSCSTRARLGGVPLHSKKNLTYLSPKLKT